MPNEKKILCLSDAQEDVIRFSRGHELAFFQIQQMSPLDHSADVFRNQFQHLQSTVDLGSIGLVLAEYTEALPLVYLMREAGFRCPAIFVPHTNPYPVGEVAGWFASVVGHGPVLARVASIEGSRHAKDRAQPTFAIGKRPLPVTGIPGP